jgi:RNA polymerase sigma-70 factor (ECF subfamily)
MNSSLHATPDTQLVLRAQNGDSAAFAELATRHYRYCVKIAFALMHNEADAEDEVQNAFISALSHLNGFESRSSFRSWLTRIVTNQCLQRHRKLRRFRPIVVENFGSTAQAGEFRKDGFVDRGKTVEQNLMEVQIGSLAFACMDRLPPVFRHVLRLSVVEDLPLATVCEKLQITPAAAKSRLCRARAELRRRLQTHLRSAGCDRHLSQ